MVMANTLRAWQDFYDKHYTRRECQAGVRTMAQWRQQLLSRETAAVPLPEGCQMQQAKTRGKKAGKQVGRTSRKRMRAASTPEQHKNDEIDESEWQTQSDTDESVPNVVSD